MTRRVAAILVVTLVAAGCGAVNADPPPLVTTGRSADTASTSAPPVESSTTPALPSVAVEQVDCPSTLDRDDVDLACGLVTVPIDRADGSAGSTRITIATLAGYDTGFATPVAVLQGGPGGASTGLGSWFPQQPFTQVFVDQRGAGFVGPDFDCPEIESALGRVMGSGSIEAGVLAENAYDDCARRLDQDPVLEHTHTDAHADDVVDVMTALGHRRWVAYGVSYGSTIGLELLRDAPTGLVGVVLDGVYPPELDADAGLVFSATRALDAIDVACAAETLCRGYLADGSVRDTLERVMDELDDDPMVVPLAANEIGFTESVDLVLDGRRVAELSFLLMYHESFIRYLPAVIGALDDRDVSAARWLALTGARQLVNGQAANDEGTYFAVQCHDRLPFTDGPGDVVEPFASAVVPTGLDEGCEEWERTPGAPAVAEPVVSTVPALLLSGEFDPITPPIYAENVADDLASATLVTQGGRGHGIWYGDECIAGLVQRFVEDPARELDTECAERGVVVEWARP